MKRSIVNKRMAAVVAAGVILASCGSDSDGSDSLTEDTVLLDSGRAGDGADGELEFTEEPATTESMQDSDESDAMGEESDETDGATSELDSGTPASSHDQEADFDSSDEASEPQEETGSDTGGLFEEEPPVDDAEADEPVVDNRFEDYGYRDFIETSDDPLSTFALDVDTGSFTVGRGYLDDDRLPPTESVRPEEYVNAFDYDYRAPRNGLDITVDGGPSPFNEDNVLVRVGVQGEIVSEDERGPASLTFVIDTSGSMNREDRLGLVKESLTILVEELNDDDTVAIVTYSDSSGIVLEPTRVSDRDRILDAIDDLGPGGSTNLESGLLEGYGLARDSFNEDGINRVIIASDGVANAGITDPDRLASMIREDADNGIDLVTVGFGMDGFNDVTMEQLADNGDGFYAYVDTVDEAERLFEDELTSTLLTIAKDAKIQVNFDESVVKSYRLIGFENRGVRDSDFRNDEVDAGELGAGHQVTAIYEIELETGISLDDREELGVVSLRWEDPDSGEVEEIDEDIDLRDIEERWTDTADDFQLATVVVTFAEKLRDNPYADDVDVENLAREAQRLADDIGTTEVDELADLIERAAELT